MVQTLFVIELSPMLSLPFTNQEFLPSQFPFFAGACYHSDNFQIHVSFGVVTVARLYLFFHTLCHTQYHFFVVVPIGP